MKTPSSASSSGGYSSPDMWLAERGAPALGQLLRDQVVREKAIEKDFYREYCDYREFVYRTLVEANPGFTGTRSQLVRLSQRIFFQSRGVDGLARVVRVS